MLTYLIRVNNNKKTENPKRKATKKIFLKITAKYKMDLSMLPGKTHPFFLLVSI